MNTLRIGFAFAPLFLIACITSEGDSGAGGEGEGGGTCGYDNGCGTPIDCPEESDPTVHYISHDPALCEQTDCGGADCLTPCEADQEYFSTECGCGCIDIGPQPTCPDIEDPTVHYISENPAECDLTDCGGPETDCVPCSGDQEYFSTECGCGCIDLTPQPEPTCPDPSDPYVHYISEDPAVCIDTDCGGESDCIPCDENQEYFDNECGCGCIDTDG